MLEKSLQSPLDNIDINIGRTDAEAPAPIFWPPDVKSQLTGKYPDSGKEIESRRRRG